jgi:Uncharacterized conserved small protein
VSPSSIHLETSSAISATPLKKRQFFKCAQTLWPIFASSSKRKKLTQAKAAEILGVSQSRVSDLARGKWEKFSLEMLIILATKAGMHVTLKTAA